MIQGKLLQQVTELAMSAVDQLVAPHASVGSDHVSSCIAVLGAAVIRVCRRTTDPLETLRLTIEGLQGALDLMEGRARRGGGNTGTPS